MIRQVLRLRTRSISSTLLTKEICSPLTSYPDRKKTKKNFLINIIIIIEKLLIVSRRWLNSFTFSPFFEGVLLEDKHE